MAVTVAGCPQGSGGFQSDSSRRCLSSKHPGGCADLEKTTAMKLQSLEIKLQPSYAANAGKYVAAIAYEDGHENAVKMVLDPGISEQLLGFIGPVITKFSAKAAKEIEANIIGALAESKHPLEITV